METSGRIWPNFELIQAFMHDLIACKYEKDQMKNSRENVKTSFSPLLVYGTHYTKREKWRDQFFRHLRAANSVERVRSGRISNSFKLLCMSSLTVSMKRIPSRTTEKKWQHCFSNYNTICCHGNQWSDLAEFQILQAFMHDLIACKYEKDQMKNSRENVKTSFSPLLVYGIFFQTLKGSQLRSPWSDLAEFQTHSSSYVYRRYLQV